MIGMVREMNCTLYLSTTINDASASLHVRDIVARSAPLLLLPQFSHLRLQFSHLRLHSSHFPLHSLHFDVVLVGIVVVMLCATTSLMLPTEAISVDDKVNWQSVWWDVYALIRIETKEAMRSSKPHNGSWDNDLSCHIKESCPNATQSQT